MGSTADRNHVLQWASAVVEGKDYVILDFQTTDLAHKGGEICQVGVLDHSGNMLMDILVQPDRSRVSPEAFKIHGLSDKLLSQHAMFAWFQERFQEIIADKLVISWGINFDLAILENTSPDIHWKTLASWQCLMDKFAPIGGSWNDYHQSYTWVKLLDACGMAGVQGRDPGSAMGNCLMVRDILLWMASQAVKEGVA